MLSLEETPKVVIDLIHAVNMRLGMSGGAGTKNDDKTEATTVQPRDVVYL